MGAQDCACPIPKVELMNTYLKNHRKILAACCAVAMATLTACGGDPEVGTATPTPPGSLVLSGTAATGSVIAGSMVETKCAVGSGNATTGSDGNYTLTVASGALPCVLRVTAGSGTVWHSVAAGTGTSVTAHITPVTHLVIAYLAGSDPADYYSSFPSATASASEVSVAAASVVDALRSGGIDLSALGSVFSAPLLPGNAYDQALEAFEATLVSSGVSFGQFGQWVAESGAASRNPIAAVGTVSLPAGMRLQPAASNCAALRSGTYRVITPDRSGQLASQTGLITIDANTLSVTYKDGDTGTLVPNGECRYLNDGGAEDVVVSQAGVIAWRYAVDGGATHGFAIAFPEQHHTVAELAGTWNQLGFERNDAGTAYSPNAATITFNASGVSSALSYCAAVKTCVEVTSSTITRVVNSSGGFTNTSSDGNDPDWTFAYRAGGGELMLVSLAGNGSFSYATRQRTNVPATVGTVSDGWTISVNGQLQVPGAPGRSTNTILSSDSVTGAYTRQATATAVGATRIESLAVNNPRAGYTLRSAESVLNSAGAFETVSELVFLGMRGMGVTPVAFTTFPQFTISVARP